jgi:hypothetical protein
MAAGYGRLDKRGEGGREGVEGRILLASDPRDVTFASIATMSPQAPCNPCSQEEQSL